MVLEEKVAGDKGAGTIHTRGRNQGRVGSERLA